MGDRNISFVSCPYSFPHHCMSSVSPFVYYESVKRELKRRLIYECRCDERLKTKTEESTRLTYTGLVVVTFSSPPLG